MALEHIEKRAGRIKALRGQRGLSQEGLADKMQEVHKDLHPDAAPDRTRGQMVSDWERAVNEPSPRKLELLAAALETTVAALNADAPDKSDVPDPFASNRAGDSEEAGALADIQAQLRELVAGQLVLKTKLVRVERLLKEGQTRKQPPAPRRKAGS